MTTLSPDHWPAHFQVRVYYEDTDAGGIVFYANYLKFFERARTEWLRQLGVSQSALARESRRIFIVAETQVKYRKPAVLDDVVDIFSRIHKLERASVFFEQTARCGAQELASSMIRVACVHADTLKPAAIPDFIRSQLFTFVQDN